MSMNLQLRQSQQLVMTPQLQQAIKLLQMSNLDLAEYVTQEIERNPLLEATSSVPEERREGSDSAGDGDGAPSGERPDLSAQLKNDSATRAEETFDTGLENVYADEARADTMNNNAAAADSAASQEASAWAGVGNGGSSRFDNPDFDLESTLSVDITLRDHMLNQLGLAPVSPVVRVIAADLIEQIDEAGYLKMDEDAVALRLGAEQADVAAAIGVVQSFEPAGIAARDLADCLRLQLAELNRLDPAMAVLVDNLDMLAKGEIPKLCKLCAVDLEDMRDMVSEIRSLDPKPGARFGGEIAQTMVPDVYVRQNSSGGWSVDLNADTLPKVLVNTRYASEIEKGGGEVKAYLTECMQSANWLVKSLDQRARTILKVSSEIVRQQDGFLAYGVSELRPLNLKTVADAIEMHESTVSRVTSNKFIATPRGVFELKFFFTAAISATDGGDSYSAESIRHKIRKMIDGEDEGAILSDDRIVKILRDQGVDIARRTVAKYREAMNIPSSVQRRRAKASLV